MGLQRLESLEEEQPVQQPEDSGPSTPTQIIEQEKGHGNQHRYRASARYQGNL